MNILVTGATGFIGSFITRELLSRGHSIICLTGSRKNTGRIDTVADRLTFVEVDYHTPSQWPQKFSGYRIDGTLHLGWAGVAGSARNDMQQIANIATACELVKLTAELGGSFFVSTGSQAEYGPVSGSINERQAENPTTLYGKAKVATKSLCQHLCTEYGLRFAWLRVFSTYGPEDNPWWMLPSLISKLAHNELPELTLGEQKWDFLHVRDAARAVCAVAENNQASGIFNLGSGTCPTLRQTIEKVRDLVSPGAELAFGAIPYRPDQVMHLQADISKLTATVGWHPQISLDEGLQETAAWFSGKTQ